MHRGAVDPHWMLPETPGSATVPSKRVRRHHGGTMACRRVYVLPRANVGCETLSKAHSCPQ